MSTGTQNAETDPACADSSKGWTPHPDATGRNIQSRRKKNLGLKSIEGFNMYIFEGN